MSKKLLKNKHFSNKNFRPLPLIINSKIIIKKRITTTIPLVFKSVWFDSLVLALSEPLSGNQSPKKIFKKAITRGWKLLSELIKWSLKSYKYPENLSKIHAEMRKLFKFQSYSSFKNYNNIHADFAIHFLIIRN